MENYQHLKAHQVTSMVRASLKWNSEMHCSFDIEEHHPTSPLTCDGCRARFSIDHGHECKKGGLVVQRYDEIKFELQDLAARALVRDEPQIYPQVVAQMLTRPKDCLHQQKNVVIY